MHLTNWGLRLVGIHGNYGYQWEHVVPIVHGDPWLWLCDKERKSLVQSVESKMTFRRNISPPYSGSKNKTTKKMHEATDFSVVRFEVFTAVTMKNVVRFEVFTAVTMKNGVFWDVAPCGSCNNYTP
jgi:hypothetical protein